MGAPLASATSPCFGHCRDCNTTHRLPVGNAYTHARALMQEFEENRRIDYFTPPAEADPRLSFDGPAGSLRGQMFGVLECRDDKGRSVVLRAFSSLPEGIREVAGWVPPVLSADSFYNVVLPGLEEVAQLTSQIKQAEQIEQANQINQGDQVEPLHPLDRPTKSDLAQKRTQLSQALWREMQTLYCFHNFRGESRSLKDAFTRGDSDNDSGKIASGVGECCAPKLLNHAARAGLTPIGIAEFYWGGNSKSGRRKQGDFYPSCEARCQPILGFMLCGLDDGS